MANLRIFIAGHVIGVTEPERAKERAKIADVADLFDAIGWDVVNPADLMDDQSDPKDITCKYIRMMMDCGFFYEFPDYLDHQECHTATMVANVYGIKPCRADFALLNKVQNLVDAIKDVTGVPFSEYSFVDRKKGANCRIIQQARTIFVHECLSMDIKPADIAIMLKKEYKDKTSADIVINRDDDNYCRNYGKINDIKSPITGDQLDFRDYVDRIEKQIAKKDLNK